MHTYQTLLPYRDLHLRFNGKLSIQSLQVRMSTLGSKTDTDESVPKSSS